MVTGTCAIAQTTPDVGSGAPTPGVTITFVNAWQRNGFNTLVGAPTGNVVKYGSAGLAQDFPSFIAGGGTYALIKPDTTEVFNVQQVFPAMLSYYGTVGVTTAGYPTSDTNTCPALVSTALASNSCQYQTFTSKYVLFVYASALSAGGPQNFATRDPYFTKWNTFGGIGAMGPAASAETTFTSTFGTAATVQQYDQGAIYNITSGASTGKLLAVKQPVYGVYVTNGGHTGSLGVPTTEELVLANGFRQQTFEGGAIQYDPATGIAVLRPPVSRVILSPVGSVHLNVGETLPAQVTLFGTDGGILTDRSIVWNTSNGRVVQILATGATAVIKGFGGGTATVTATSEGKLSASLVVSVTALCCQIGEGAPTGTVRAFQDAVTRNRLNIQVPAPSPAARAGKGYVQTLTSTSTPPVTYLVAVPDGSSTGYVIGGALLAQYQLLGGPSGALGYPASDSTPGGRQTFQLGTLAGSPPRVVSGAILAKWGSLGFETGSAGPPTGAAAALQTFRGTSGIGQPFQNVLIVTQSTGQQAGQTFAVGGAVLASYAAIGGPSGELGAPLGDERTAGLVRQQDFEGGSINYPPGSAQATVVKAPRVPLVTATPSMVVSGTPVHLVIGGFAAGATLRVSQTGQADFVVTAANGSYAWDAFVPGSAASGTVTVRAVDANGTGSAQAFYTIRNVAASTFSLTIVSGDQQAGAPGSLLTQPLTVVVKDSNGTPLAEQTVAFAASTGAQIVPKTAVTGADGTASATVRMPPAAGIALATATAEHLVVTFSARASAVVLSNFPNLTQAVDGVVGKGSATIRRQGSLLVSAAAILRYHQARNDLPQPNGLADPAALNEFLKSVCLPDAGGVPACDGFFTLGGQQTVNLWRLGGFVANNVDIHLERATVDAVRDLVAGGSPVLLALALNTGGSHFVVSNGIAADGTLTIADPDPTLGQSNLNAYLNGFNSPGGVAVKASLTGAARLLPQAPSPAGFAVASTAPVAISSRGGACGEVFQVPDTEAKATAGSLYFQGCDGSAAPYQFDIAAKSSFDAVFTPVAPAGGREVLSGAGSISSLLEGVGTGWRRSPVQPKFDGAGVVNAASFTGDMAPGGAISIFGAGLAGLGAPTAVTVNSFPAFVYFATPFQVNLQIPPDVKPGSASVSVTTPSGSFQRLVGTRPVAPAIFSVGVAQGAITNQDGSLNTPSNPARRGSAVVIYGTGFGATQSAGGLDRVATPLTVVVGSSEIPTFFAGLTPGIVGLYQANVLLPAAMPPGLALPLSLKQADAVSNSVTLAVQ